MPVLDVDIDLVTTDAVRAAVWRLRYDVFVRERHWAPPEADHLTCRVRDQLDPRALVLAATDRHSHAVVGTIRTNLLRVGSIPVYPALYRLTDLSSATWAICSITTYLGVATTHRRAGLSTRLSAAMFEQRVAAGVKFDYLDCSTDLVKYFTKFGYRWLRAIRHPWYGPSQLMRLSLDDTDYLTQIRSPLLAPKREAPQ